MHERNVGTIETGLAHEPDFRVLAGHLFQALQKHPIPLVVSNARKPENEIVFVNDAFLRATGYESAEIIGRPYRIVYAMASRPDAAAIVEAAFDEGQSIETEVHLCRKDGTTQAGILSAVPIAAENDAVGHYLSIFVETPFGRADTAEVALIASQTQLAEVKERLRLTLSLTGAAAAWEWHISQNYIVGDTRFAALYGIKAHEAARGISPEVFFSIIHPEDQARVRLAIGGILRGAEVFSKQFRVLLPNGSVRWMNARGRCHYDDNDRATRFTGVLIDITEHKLAEERLRVAQSSGGIGTFEHIEGFATASVSTQFCELLGLQASEDLPVHTINSVVRPDCEPLIGAPGRHSAGSQAHSEFLITRPDTGETRWLAKRGEYQRDAETAGVKFSGVIYDITRSKEIEENLRSLNETLESRVQERTRERDGIWQLSKDLLGVADAKGVWQSVNPAWTRVLGWQAAEIIGRTTDGLQHPGDAESVRIPQGAPDGITLSFQNRLRTRQGDYRSLSWTAVSQQGLLYCVAHDVTEQLRHEETLARAEEQLRQSHKMEAVGQLTGGIAHDFNNMLTGVISALGLIQRRLKAGRTDELDAFIEAGMDSARRAASLTHSLLAFARRQSLDVKGQDINGLVSGVQEILRRPLGEDIALDLRLQPDLWTALTDANQLENALLNLVLNARDAMPDGGCITLETFNKTFDTSRPMHDGAIAEGDYVVVSVADTGSGMSRDVIAKAFEPFFTTKPIGQGTGLGLSMIYGFVRQSGGHVSIDSDIGRGTRVQIYLPRSQTSDAQIQQPDSSSVTSGAGEVILVVEDDDSVRFTVTMLLRELGYSYVEAADASVAIPYLQSNQRIDLLVTDVGLPNMNGRQLAELGRQHRPDLKVLFISGYAEKEAVRAGALDAGMKMLAKPFTVDVLAAKIREMLDT